MTSTAAASRPVLLSESKEGLECIHVEPVVNKHRRHDLLRVLRRFQVLRRLRLQYQCIQAQGEAWRKYKSKNKDAVSVADTTASTASLAEDDLERDDEEGVEVPLMQQRLLAMGLIEAEDYYFTTDKVSKEVKHLYESDDAPQHVEHVKTGVWQISAFDAKGVPEEPSYVVTAVSMDDRVDTKKLRKAIYGGSPPKRRPKLAMAPTPIAEELAGYQSGTMAPICHTIPMKLFMEETVVADAHRELWMGSGMMGRCLALNLDKFVEIADTNPHGYVVCPLVQKRKQKS